MFCESQGFVAGVWSSGSRACLEQGRPRACWDPAPSLYCLAAPPRPPGVLFLSELAFPPLSTVAQPHKAPTRRRTWVDGVVTHHPSSWAIFTSPWGPVRPLPGGPGHGWWNRGAEVA